MGSVYAEDATELNQMDKLIIAILLVVFWDKIAAFFAQLLIMLLVLFK